MRDRLDEFGDAEVVVITFTRQRNLRGYRARFVSPLPVLADEDRHVYRAYGLGRGPWWRVYGPRVWLEYARLMRRGDKFERPGRHGHEDTLQLGGDFVVGRDGHLTLVFRSKGPDDRPPVDALIAAAAVVL